MAVMVFPHASILEVASTLDPMRAANRHLGHEAYRWRVVSPDGRQVREVTLKGRKPTNVAFGGPDGRTVFVTLQDRGAIEAFRVAIPGRETGL